MEVLGISMLTNLAAGLGDKPLHHSEVVAVGKEASEKLGKLLLGAV